jgi:hypothetical protein
VFSVSTQQKYSTFIVRYAQQHCILILSAMKKLCCMGLLLVWAMVGYAQKTQRPVREPSTTRYLKDLYQYVKDKARRNQYYMNEFSVNTHSLAWKDNKVKHKAYIFYYSFSGDNKPLLRLAVFIHKQDKIDTRYEFMYDNDGNVAFCLEKQNNETFPYRECQVFYEKGLCINLILDKEVIDQKATEPYQEKIDRFKSIGNSVYAQFFQDQESIK